MYSDIPFSAFGWSHGLAIVVMILVGGLLGYWLKKPSESGHRGVRITIAVVLVFSVMADMLNTWGRYGAEGMEKMHQNAYPVFLCDVVAVVLAVAIVRRSQRLAEIGYVWGLAGTLQGLITPVLEFDAPSAEYFCFFLQHGLVPVTGVIMVWVMGLKPQPGAYRRVWLWTWGYLAVAMTFNALAGTNYGFLNDKPSVATVMDYLGDYPYYLISLHAIAAVMYAVLLWPFRKKGVS